jgi:Peptidase family M23
MVRRAMFTLIVGVLLLALAPASAYARDDDGRPEAAITALEVREIAPPRWVTGTDDQVHIEYDLAITNTFTSDVTLRSLEVLDERGATLLRLEGDALAAVTTRFLDYATPTVVVPPSVAVQTVVDVALPADARVPGRLSHRLDYDFPPDALFHQIIGSRQVDGPVLRVERRQPIVISPPLKGSGWVAVNACCQPSSHRSFVLAANGGFVTPEVFAIDWIQVRDGRLAEGDGSTNEQWFGHGEPIFAAASGEVVEVVNDKPEVPPGISLDDNPTIQTTVDFGGNHALIRIRRGVYALYAHMIPGSIQVQVGDRVETGQQLGLLGNTGNTSAPHLHFGLIDGLGVLSSDSLPFVIDRFTFEGQAEFMPTGEVTITGTPRRVRNAHPLTNSVASFSSSG